MTLESDDIDPRLLYSDSEFCPKCGVLLDHGVSVAVTVNRPERIMGDDFECCGAACAIEILKALVVA